MSATELIGRIRSLPVGERLEWSKIRDEIAEEYSKASESDRVSLLELFNVIMDSVESNVSRPDLAGFRTARAQDYNRMLVSECLIDERVSPNALGRVTQREVAAGRMSPDHELRRLAVSGPGEVSPETQPNPRKGFFRGAFSWLGRGT